MGLVLGLLLALGAAPDRDALGARLAAIRRGDVRALLDLGRRARQAGFLRLAARSYRRVLAEGGGEGAPEARLELARIATRSGDHAEALPLLVELLRAGRAAASPILAEWETGASRAQRALLAEGSAKTRDGRLREARAAYEEALALAPPADLPVSPGALASPEQVLARIGRLNDREDRRRFDRAFGPAPSPPKPCTRCKGGFRLCPRCKGRGYTIRRRRFGRKVIETKLTCTRCRGLEKVLCEVCWGLEHALPRLSTRERRALARILESIASREALTGTLRAALLALENRILGAAGPEVRLLARTAPRYTWSRAIRRAFPAFPLPLDRAIPPLEDLWEAAGRKVEVRPNLLLGYACEFARAVEAWAPLRSPAAPLALPDRVEPEAPAVPPEALWAFPERYRGPWAAVRGTFGGLADEGPWRAAVEIRSTEAHGVRFFVWKAPARAALAHFGRTAWRDRTRRLAASYPFAIEATVRALEPGREIEVTGRLLRDPEVPGGNWFEIRRIRAGRSAAERRLAGVLGRRVGITATAIPLGSLMAHLRTWFGAALRADGIPPDRPVTVAAQGAPVGLLVEALASSLGRRIDVDAAGRIALVQAREAPGDPAIAEALAALRRPESAPILAAVLPPQASRTPEPAPAGQIAEALARAREALARCRFAAAASIALAGLERAEGPAREALAELAARAVLCDRLATGIRPSRLGGAKALARVRFRDPRGVIHERTVEVLREDGGRVRVRTAEDAEIEIAAVAVVERRSVTAAWEEKRLEGIAAAHRRRLEGAPEIESAAGAIAILRFCAARGLPGWSQALDDLLADSAFAPAVRLLFRPPEREAILEARRRLPGGDPRPGARPPAPFPPLDGPLAPDPAGLAARAREHIRAGRIERLRALPGLPEADPALDRALRHVDRALACLRAADPKPEQVPAIEALRRKAQDLRAAIVRDLRSL